MMLRLALIGGLCAPCLALSPSVHAAPQRHAMLVPLPERAAWQDLAFLAAVPAASVATGGAPIVIAVGPDHVLAPEILDFLVRYRPEHVSWIGSGPEAAKHGDALAERLSAASADEVACALARRFFADSEKAVLVLESDYASALAASALAARWRAPLFFCEQRGPSDATRAVLAEIGASTVLLVGDVVPRGPRFVKGSIERLRGPDEVARWMQRNGLAVEYLAATAPCDRGTGHVRKLSLAAAALAAGRRGAVVPVGGDEAPAKDAAAARAVLERTRAVLRAAPEYLCLVAMPEAIAMPASPAPEGIDSDPPSDLAYGNVDADPFLELAVGRFVAESGAAGTLLAARSLAYGELASPAWSDRFAVAEWERLAAPAFVDAGFAPVVQEGAGPISRGSPWTSVAALVHGAHSSWLQLGSTYAHDSDVLVAPCVVESSGCSPASLDQDPERRSVALRLLRNGAVAFVGNVRRAIAEQEIYRSEFWNGVLAGASLGRANRAARNRTLVAVLAKGEAERGPHRYQLHNGAFYGDPALVMRLPTAPKGKPAEVVVRGHDVTIRAPSEWWSGEALAVEDWKYTASAKITGWRGAGVGVESSWDAEHRRNREVLVLTAEVRTSLRVDGLEAIRPPPAPLGWDGKVFQDEHSDGSRSLWFRVRLIDFDMGAGEVLQQVEDLRFRLE